MKRRSFFGAVVAIAATVLAPPLRAARERLRRRPQLQWEGLSPRWEHLRTPEPAPWPESFVEYGESDAKVVARVLRSASPGKGTLVTDGDFEAAMRECADHGTDRHSLPLTRQYSGPSTSSRNSGGLALDWRELQRMRKAAPKV